MLKKNTYLNYYGNSFSDGYANFIPINGSIPNQIDDYFSFNLSITQKEKTNKLNINLKSYSFYIKKPIIYYLIINLIINERDVYNIFPEERNFDKYKMILKVEDNGENEIFQTEVEINKELLDYENDHSSNYMIIIPIDKETNFMYISSDISYFKYKNLKSNTTLIIIIVIVIIVLLIVVGLLIYRKMKKGKSNDIEDNIDVNEKILSDN